MFGLDVRKQVLSSVRSEVASDANPVDNVASLAGLLPHQRTNLLFCVCESKVFKMSLLFDEKNN